MGIKDIIRKAIITTPLVNIPLTTKKDYLTILCIHGVTQHRRLGNTANYEGRHIHKDTFSGILKYFLRYFNPISLEQLEGYYYRGKSLPPNPMFLTFDDGFANNYFHAFPILKKYNCPAVIFISTNLIDNKNGYWVERLEYSIYYTEQKQLQICIQDNTIDLPLYTYSEKEFAYKAVLKRLKNGLNLSQVNDAVFEICKHLGFPDLNVIEDNEDYRFLTWEQVKEMTAYGISFGAHTVNHPNLTYEDIERAVWEIQTSKQEVESQLGRECIVFCYPFGRSGYNGTMEGLLKDAGFRFSFQLGGELNVRNTNPLLLNRIPLGWESKKEDILWHILRK